MRNGVVDYMLDFKKIAKNEIKVMLGVLVFSSLLSFLLYVYMSLPHKFGFTDNYELVVSKSFLEKEEFIDDEINIAGWFIVDGQQSSAQAKKEIVLSNGESTYSYPVQYSYRQDVVDIYHNNQYAWSGFLIQINTKFIQSGVYKLYIRYIYDGKDMISDLKREIILK